METNGSQAAVLFLKANESWNQPFFFLAVSKCNHCSDEKARPKIIIQFHFVFKKMKHIFGSFLFGEDPSKNYA